MTGGKMLKKCTAVEGGFSYLGAVAAYLVIMFVFSLIAYASGGAIGKIGDYIATLLLQICFLLAAVLPFKAMNSRPTYLPSKISVKAGFVSVGIACMCVIFFTGLSVLFNSALAAAGYNGSSSTDMGSPIGIIFAVIISVLLAPVCEEMLFRSSVLSSLGVMFGRKRDTLITVFMTVLCGAAFALMHANPEQTVYQFFLGAVMAYAVIRTGSVTPAIIIHAVNNVIGLVLSIPAIDGGISGVAASVIASGYGIAVFAVVSVVLAVAGVFVNRLVIKKMGDRAPEPVYKSMDAESGFVNYADDGGTVAGAVFCVVAALICAALWTVNLIGGFTVQ